MEGSACPDPMQLDLRYNFSVGMPFPVNIHGTIHDGAAQHLAQRRSDQSANAQSESDLGGSEVV